MNLIHPDASLIPILDRELAVDIVYRLASAIGGTPGLDSVLADFTQSAGTGYVAVTISLADWLMDSIVSRNASKTAGDISFVCSSGSYSVVGYYITNAGNTELLGFVEFPASVTVDGSNPLIVTPKWGAKSKYAA